MSIQADTRAWRQRHRLYGVRVPCAQVPLHLLNGWRILSAAEDIRDDVLMSAPPNRLGGGPARTINNGEPPVNSEGHAA